MDARPGTVGGAGAVVTAMPNFKLRDQFDSAICRVCHRLVDRLWVAIAADRSEQVVCCDACAQPTERDAAIKRAEQRERELRRSRRRRWESGEAAFKYWEHVGTDFGTMPDYRKTGALRGGVRAE